MHRDRPRFGHLFLVLAAVSLCIPGASGQQDQHRTNLLDLKLGTAAADLPEEAFIDYACGTDGGPPGRAIGSFRDFAKCAAEPSGLHEVAFRYDDELEYRLLARGDTSGAEMNGGTSVGDIAVYASALFDDSGALRGLRAVTDDRAALRNRTTANLMADYVQNYFGRENLSCTDHDLTDGQEPISGQYVNRTCRGTADGTLVYTEAHLFRKAGQTEVNRSTGQLNRGQFESSARIELREAGAPADGSGKPTVVAIGSAAPARADDLADFKAGRSKDCPGCDLRGLDLRHRDLTGARLDGADLTGADFYAADLSNASCHDCRLDGARFKRATLTKADFSNASITDGNFHAARMRSIVLDGADLSRADLNRTDMGFASLAGAKLNGALLYDAELSGADLSRADLTQALAGTARLPRAKLDGAILVTADMRGTKLRGASLDGAKLDGSALDNADMRDIEAANASMVGTSLPWVDIRGATLTGANLDHASFYSADLRDADLTGAILTNGDLHRAYLSGAILDNVQLAGTKMPDGAIHQ